MSRKNQGTRRAAAVVAVLLVARCGLVRAGNYTFTGDSVTHDQLLLGDYDEDGEVLIDGQGNPAVLTLASDAAIIGPGYVYGTDEVFGGPEGNPTESLIISGTVDTEIGYLERHFGLGIHVPATLTATGVLSAETEGSIGFTQPLTLEGGTITGRGFVNSFGTIDAYGGVTVSGPVEKTGPSVFDIRQGSLTLTPDGVLNLDDGWLAVNPTVPIRQLIQQAYDGGKWDGAGIASNIVRNDSTMGIGYAPRSAISISSPGASIDDSATFARATLFGDTDLNGSVLLDSNPFVSDLSNFIGGLNGRLSGWLGGDFNYDGMTDIPNDFALFVRGYLSSSGGAQAEQALVSNIDRRSDLTAEQKAEMVSLVPEPGSVGIIGCCVVGAVIRRRRR